MWPAVPHAGQIRRLAGFGSHHLQHSTLGDHVDLGREVQLCFDAKGAGYVVQVAITGPARTGHAHSTRAQHTRTAHAHSTSPLSGSRPKVPVSPTTTATGSAAATATSFSSGDGLEDGKHVAGGGM